MVRIKAIEPTEVDTETQSLFARLAQKLGRTPNLVRTMAVSPAVLEAYLGFGRSMSRSSLTPRLREQIGLAVSELNRCHYCLAAHTAFGRTAGLDDEEIGGSRRGVSQDRKANAILQFAQRIVNERGLVSDDDAQTVRDAGLNEAEIVDTVAAVALNIFTNYFIQVAGTEIDFPEVGPAEASVLKC